MQLMFHSSQFTVQKSPLVFKTRRLSTGNRQPHLNGFTLLEVMISLGILSVIFTLLYGTFNAVHRGGQEMEAEADMYRLLRLGSYHMSNNLSMIYVDPTPNGNTPLLQGINSERLVGDDSYANDSLQFVSVSHGRTPNAPESERATVRYVLKGNILMQEMLLSNGRILNHEIGGPIEGLNFRYFDAIKKQWVEHWNNPASNKLPLAIEIEFVLKQAGGEPHRFKTWVDLPKT